MKFTQPPHAACTYLFVFVWLVLIAGCSKERTFDREPTYPIIGKLLIDGKPVEPPLLAAVRAVAVDAATSDGKKDTSAQSWTEPDGSFALSTYVKGDGVRAGTYKITFETGIRNLMTGGIGGDVLEGQYKNPDTSEYEVTITGDETEPIDLGTVDLSTP